MMFQFAKRSAGVMSLALHRVFGDRKLGGMGILLYHRVEPATGHRRQPTWNVDPTRFRKQLTSLLADGYEPCSLRAALDSQARGLSLAPRSFVVTFDDAYASVFLHAWPILRELRVPATIFLSTAYLDWTDPFPFDQWGLAHRNVVSQDTYRPLSFAECQEMARDGLIEFGTHTHTHQDLRGRAAELLQELQVSIDIVREVSGQEAIPFAFPYGRRYSGYASADLVDAARRAGVTCALSTESELVDPGQDPFTWGRFNVYPWDSGATLAARLSGWYGWTTNLQSRCSSLMSKSQGWLGACLPGGRSRQPLGLQPLDMVSRGPVSSRTD